MAQSLQKKKDRRIGQTSKLHVVGIIIESETWLCYTTDMQHSYKSRDLIGVCDNKATAAAICQEHAKKGGELISHEQLQNLMNIQQTQWHDGENEYVIEKVKRNSLF